MNKKPKYWYCDSCNGCGWAEGGKTIKTNCKDCAGHGIVLTKGLKILTVKQVKEVKEILSDNHYPSIYNA